MAVLELIGSSAKFRDLLDNVGMVAPVDSAVLIQGETWTGKEVIARAIHEASPSPRTLLWRSIARRIRVLCWRVNCLATKTAHSQAPWLRSRFA